MPLLDSLPHTATARVRTRTKDSLGGSSDAFSTDVFTARPCWQQPAKESEIREFAKRGVSVTNKVYFTTRPALDEQHILIITNKDTGQTDTFEVRSRADPDASAGLGVLYRVMCELTTTGSTSTA